MSTKTHSVAVARNSQLGPEDLDIYFEVGGVPTDPFEILFDVYDFTTGTEVLINPADRTPNKISTGHYYAPIYIPSDAPFGEYHIKWKYRLQPGDPQSIETDEFFVVEATGLDPELTDTEKELVRQLRVLLRDNKPDKYYHFMPPTHEEEIQSFTSEYRYIWEDSQLVDCLNWACWDLNNIPPRKYTFTLDSILNGNPHQKRVLPLLLVRAACYALDMLAVNWTADEFSYSINGISLDLDKSSAYRDMKDAFNSQYREMVEDYQRTVKIIKGLRPSYYTVGFGLSGAAMLGPRTSGRNIRNYIRR